MAINVFEFKPTPDTTLEQDVDNDINEFEAYFTGALRNSPLVHGERAILKTYLHWKITGGVREGAAVGGAEKDESTKE